MTSSTIILAFALMLIVEGLFPFAAPERWRQSFRKITEMPSGQIRFFGLAAVLLGLMLMLLADY
ncbi:hypothetical protein MB84_14205 [Pandoraea oxalativorans]|uniref:DUF2065 domain-containing protein n=2 Tax=Pandoraea oxalativorans TaxID=573737 RepID=A0A0E3U6Y1_9BURK|nr:hypothetical protein MB84_14205 [Pandoraea oxalativorans]